MSVVSFYLTFGISFFLYLQRQQSEPCPVHGGNDHLQMPPPAVPGPSTSSNPIPPATSNFGASAAVASTSNFVASTTDFGARNPLSDITNLRQRPSSASSARPSTCNLQATMRAGAAMDRVMKRAGTPLPDSQDKRAKQTNDHDEPSGEEVGCYFL